MLLNRCTDFGCHCHTAPAEHVSEACMHERQNFRLNAYLHLRDSRCPLRSRSDSLPRSQPTILFTPAYRSAPLTAVFRPLRSVFHPAHASLTRSVFQTLFLHNSIWYYVLSSDWKSDDASDFEVVSGQLAQRRHLSYNVNSLMRQEVYSTYEIRNTNSLMKYASACIA